MMYNSKVRFVLIKLQSTLKCHVIHTFDKPCIVNFGNKTIVVETCDFALKFAFTNCSEKKLNLIKNDVKHFVHHDFVQI